VGINLISGSGDTGGGNSSGGSSYRLGTEVGKSLNAQNRDLFPDKDKLCADAFTDYSRDRDLVFDEFFRGCKAGWGG
jgi:hypothetical protein